MDNNNQTENPKTNTSTPPSVETPTQAPGIPQTVVQPMTPPTGSTNIGGAKKTSPMIWIIGAVIILILILAGAYLYLNLTSTTQPEPQTQVTPKTPEASLESELNSVNVESEESDFVPVDKDLQNL